MSKHILLSPTTNVVLILLWAIVIVFLLLIVQPPLPVALAMVGGVLGSVAGVMQHLSIAQGGEGFVAASFLMGVRRAFTSTRWGRRYIMWLYFCKLTLIVIAFLLIRSPLYRVVMGYLVAYVSLMFVRDLLTLRDTFTLHRLEINTQGRRPELS
jgi:hypothetical protein